MRMMSLMRRDSQATRHSVATNQHMVPLSVAGLSLTNVNIQAIRASEPDHCVWGEKQAAFLRAL